LNIKAAGEHALDFDPFIQSALMQAERKRLFTACAVEHNMNLKTRESATDISQRYSSPQILHRADQIKENKTYKNSIIYISMARAPVLLTFMAPGSGRMSANITAVDQDRFLYKEES
jgi:hypothetical protein